MSAPVVATVEELDALPEGSVVLDSNELAWQQDSDGSWYSDGAGRAMNLPARVLYRPDAPAVSVDPSTVEDEGELFDLLQAINESSEQPERCGYDRFGRPVFVWLNEEGGDSVYLCASHLWGEDSTRSEPTSVDPKDLAFPIMIAARPDVVSGVVGVREYDVTPTEALNLNGHEWEGRTFHDGGFGTFCKRCDGWAGKVAHHPCDAVVGVREVTADELAAVLWELKGLSPWDQRYGQHHPYHRRADALLARYRIVARQDGA